MLFSVSWVRNVYRELWMKLENMMLHASFHLIHFKQENELHDSYCCWVMQFLFFLHGIWYCWFADSVNVKLLQQNDASDLYVFESKIWFPHEWQIHVVLPLFAAPIFYSLEYHWFFISWNFSWWRKCETSEHNNFFCHISLCNMYGMYI